MLLKIRIVHWIDSSLQNDQVNKEDFPKPVTVTSVGFVIEENSEYLTLARDDMSDGEYRGLCCIPKVSILYVE
jgi:hypothetical protein